MKKKINWEKLANTCLDILVDMYSPNEMAEMLYEYGYTSEELLTLGFDEDTIELIFEKQKDEMDDTEDRDYQAFKDGDMN